MARDIPPEFNALKNERFLATPWIWLLEAEVPTDPVLPIRICNHTKTVDFDSNNLGMTDTYYPAAFSFGDVRFDTEGSLPNLPLTISNVTREILAILLNNDFLVGQDARLILVNASTLDNAAAKIEILLQVRSVSENNSTITFNLSSYSLNDISAPQLRMSRTGCWHDYGDDGCGFDIPTLDPGLTILGACGKTFADCEARGARELALAAPVIHPQRIGLFRGLPLAGQ